MTLVDASIWIEHPRSHLPQLACGHLYNRQTLLVLLTIENRRLLTSAMLSQTPADGCHTLREPPH